MGRQYKNFDWVSIVILFCIGLFSLFLLVSIGESLFVQQLVYLCISLCIAFFIAKVDRIFLWWFAPFSYGIGCLFLASSYLGPVIRGAKRWIELYGYQFQPSELAKPLFLLAFAWMITKYPPRNMRNILINCAAFILPFFLVFKQPDFGSSIVYASFWLTMLFAGGIYIPIMIFAFSLIGIAVPFFWNMLAQYQKNRILTFLRPDIDPQGAGYNALQAMIAVGSGQIFGRGLGRGTQSHLRFLPEFHTDFIFATLVEELGFVGGAILLICYGFLLWRIISKVLNRNITHLFPYTFALGFAVMLLTQIVINTGMNMGIIPITGITLPFVSYGGSSMISIAVSFGLFWAICRKESIEDIAIH